ncbi:MAG: hypothetical protein D6702_05305 [Planctomycetota bacterium]|nr:MAG: hypothetical protein D6702_05305 [Planctomycetota bacterium]
MSFLRDSVGAFVLQILAVGLQFLGGVFLARGLGSEGKGIQALVILIPDMARAVAHLGFGMACTRQIVKKPEESGRVAANLVLFAAVAGAVVCTALFLGFSQLQEFVRARSEADLTALGGDLELAIRLAILGFPLLLLEGFLSGALVGRRAILAANSAKVIQTGSFALLVPLLFWLDAPTVAAAIKAWALSFALGDAAALLALWTVLLGPRRPDRRLGKAALTFGLKAWPTSITVYLLFRIDVVILRYLGTAEQVGVYSIAAALSMMFQIVGFSIERALAPRIMGKEKEEADVLTPLVTRSFLLVAFPLAAVSALLAWPGVPLIFGREYAGAVAPLAIILPGLVIGNVGQLANTDLLGRGYPGYASISAVLALAVNVGLNFLLIPRLGIVGCGLASLVCYSMFGLVLALIYRRLTGVPVRALIVPRRQDLGRIRDLLRRRGGG